MSAENFTQSAKLLITEPSTTMLAILRATSGKDKDQPGHPESLGPDVQS